MQSFPAFFRLDNARIALVGDDPGHHPKAWLFEQAPCEVVAMTAEAALAHGALQGFRFAFIHLADPEMAAILAEAARASGTLVNVTDRPELCDFYTPAIIDRGRVVVAIGTGGSAPVLATRLRSQIEARLPEGLDRVAELSERLREVLKAEVPDFQTRRLLWRKVLSGAPAHAAVEGDLDAAERLARAIIRGEAEAPAGKVLFLACDKAERLTLGALRTLIAADRTVGGAAEVAAYARRDAHREAEAGAEQLAEWARGGEVVVVISDGPTTELELAVSALGAEVETLM
jgi:precorrin-2 dehydrogenase/sirohydrochlorin ferrochelatase